MSAISITPAVVHNLRKIREESLRRTAHYITKMPDDKKLYLCVPIHKPQTTKAMSIGHKSHKLEGDDSLSKFIKEFEGKK